MRVVKFGGSSVATAERIRKVTEIVLNTVKEEPVIVVVSAFQGVSNQLLACAQMAAAGDPNYQTIYEQIVTHHQKMIEELFDGKPITINPFIDQLLHDLDEILQGIFLLKELTAGAQDHICSFGERLSASIIAAYINQQYPAEYVDARKLIFTDGQYHQANVILDKTNEAISQYYETCLSKYPLIPIVTGYIASTLDGRTTTLGRNSSDYTAAIIGAALEASQIEIWTDVNGIYSADPNIVPSAFIVPQLSFSEAIELSYFGAKVVHPSTYMAVIDKSIPLVIKNTMNPLSPGTLISNQRLGMKSKKWMAKSVTAIDDITLIIWKGVSIDVSGTIERLFRSLTLAHINIFLILEGSPKHTICLAISHKELERARKALQHDFHFELQHQLVSFEEKTSQSIIAIIGDDMMKLSPEIAGKMFQALGRMNINIKAIVQGASDQNLSLVIDSHQRNRALNEIHQAFFSESKCLTLIVIGAGRIGTAVLEHLKEQHAALKKRKINVNVCAIANSRHMVLHPKGIHLEQWREQLNVSMEKFEIARLLKMLSQIECSNVALVDCTASDAIVEAYPLFIQEGVHVITPNKRANVLPTPQYQTLMKQFKSHHANFLCRTNVGAGLPILSVLEDLLACGDSIMKIEGIISGTLSYLFNHYDGSESFSAVLKKAQDLGMTEPDPREDLSGLDVGRKLLILARTMGWQMDMKDIQVENLVPESLRNKPYSPEFFKEFEAFEANFKERIERCKRENKVLRYIGVLHNQKAVAGLQEIPMDHPLALAVHSDNIIAFTTSHYHETPLIIRGPGAGVECTAQGVFSDILKLISYLPS